MSRRVIYIIAGALVALVLLVAGTAGYLMGKSFRTDSGGQTRNSPDKRWVAHATNFKEWSLTGGSRRFSELRIESATKAGQIVRKMVIEDTAEPAVDWTQEGEIFWSRNSAAVTFKCVIGKANLEINMVP
jgi:hypothetical protein